MRKPTSDNKRTAQRFGGISVVTTTAAGCCSSSALFYSDPSWPVPNRSSPALPRLRPGPRRAASKRGPPDSRASPRPRGEKLPPLCRAPPGRSAEPQHLPRRGGARSPAPAHGDQVPPLHRSVAGAQALLAAAAATAAAAAPAQAPQAPGGHGGLTSAPPLSPAVPQASHTCVPRPSRNDGSPRAGRGARKGARSRQGVEGSGAPVPRLHARVHTHSHTLSHTHTRARVTPPPSRARAPPPPSTREARAGARGLRVPRDAAPARGRACHPAGLTARHSSSRAGAAEVKPPAPLPPPHTQRHACPTQPRPLHLWEQGRSGESQ